MVVLLNCPMNDLELVADAGAMASPAVSTPAAAVATAARVIRFVPRIRLTPSWQGRFQRRSLVERGQRRRFP
jgi:hypothetical protein